MTVQFEFCPGGYKDETNQATTSEVLRQLERAGRNVERVDSERVVAFVHLSGCRYRVVR